MVAARVALEDWEAGQLAATKEAAGRMVAAEQQVVAVTVAEYRPLE